LYGTSKRHDFRPLATVAFGCAELAMAVDDLWRPAAHGSAELAIATGR
jgi:hypothetical protein